MHWNGPSGSGEGSSLFEGTAFQIAGFFSMIKSYPDPSTDAYRSGAATFWSVKVVSGPVENGSSSVADSGSHFMRLSSH